MRALHYVRSGRTTAREREIERWRNGVSLHLRISRVRSGENSKTSNMADPSNEPASSSGIAEQVAVTAAVPAVAAPLREDHEKPEDFHEPDKKRRRTTRAEDAAKTEQKLEHRLGGILCCAVCLDLPRAAVYQVGRPTFSPSAPFSFPTSSAGGLA